MTKKKRIHYAFIILLAVSLIRGVSGPAINASSGLFLTPVSDTLGVGIGKLSLYLSISSISTLIWLPFSGNLFQKYSVKSLAFMGVLLQTISFSLLGTLKSVWGFYLLSIPLAMGGTLLVNLLGPILINRWFVSNTGLMMGIMMTITSLSGAIFQPVLSAIIAAQGWRFTYMVFGIFALIFISLIILIMLRNHPKDVNLSSYRSKHNTGVESNGSERMLEGISASNAMKSPAFYMILFFMIVLTAFAAFSQHVTTFGLNNGFTLKLIGLALSISMVGAAIGSILIGILSDKMGVVKTCICVCLTGIISVVLYFFSGNIFILFGLASFLHGLASSSIGIIAPLLTTAFFGKKDYEKLFSRIMMGAPLASIVLLPVYGFIYDYTGSYRFVLYFLICLLLLGVLSMFGAKKYFVRIHN